MRSSIQSAKPRPGADCDSNHELIIAKLRLKLKKVAETTRPFSSVQFSSVAQSCSILCDPMNGLHTRPPCPSPTPRVHPNPCDLNQIPYDYALEVTNRFNGLDLIDRVPEELQMEVHNIVQETMTKIIPKKKKCKRQNGCLRRPYK